MNLYITKSLMDELRESIPARERTTFVEEILQRELRHRKLQETLKKSFGAWKDEDHPELNSGEDIQTWIESGRKSATRDWLKEWGEDA
jgi:hypothetical protein